MESEIIFKNLKLAFSRAKSSQYNRLAPLFWYYYNMLKLSKTFYFNRKAHNYFYHIYNVTWKNERAVEVPIIWDYVKKMHGKRILEVGNVLSNYFPVSHDIVDKYDMADNVINCDVCEFQSSINYDLIVSISTLEHVGWDENPREPFKIHRAIENLKNLLNNGGKIIVTLPLGYNDVMDKLLDEGKIQFTQMYCLKRVNENNKWIEVNWRDVVGSKYDYLNCNANGLVIGIIE